VTPTCIHSRHGEEPPLADDGLMLCRHCLGRLNRALSDIVTLWPLLDEMITPGNNGVSYTDVTLPTIHLVENSVVANT